MQLILYVILFTIIIMLIAIIMAGHLRGLNETSSHIKNKIIIDKDNKYDFYIHYSNIDNINESKYDNKVITIDEVIKIFNPKCILYNEEVRFTNDKTKNSILNQNYKYYLLNKYKNNICIRENINYDVVIKIRPDVLLNEQLVIDNIEKNTLYLPLDSKIDKNKLQHPDDKYVCDIIAYGSTEIMNKYFDFFNSLEYLITSYGLVNETLLYEYLNSINITYKEIDINFIVVLSNCFTIAVTGDSGSGKTTLSNFLKKIFKKSFTLECDRYHKWDRYDEKWSKYTHLNPEANYITKMQKDVFDLKLGHNIYQVNYDHKTGLFTDKECIESTPNLIVCGLHSLYLSSNIINLKIYMDTDDNIRIPWKISRDVKIRGYTKEKVYKQIIDRIEEFKLYIEPQKYKADIIINMYTDKKFNKDKYVIDEDIVVKLRIGISTKYNINNILNNTEFYDRIENVIEKELDDEKNIINENTFVYFYYPNILNYEEIVISIITNLK